MRNYNLRTFPKFNNLIVILPERNNKTYVLHNHYKLISIQQITNQQPKNLANSKPLAQQFQNVIFNNYSKNAAS